MTLMDRAPAGSSPNYELRILLARINAMLHEGIAGYAGYAGYGTIKQEVDLVWASLSAIDQELDASRKFKDEFNGDPFRVSADYVHYIRHNEVSIAAAVTSAAVALNKMVAMAQTLGLEVSISPHPSNIGVGVTVYQRTVVGEVKLPQWDAEKQTKWDDDEV